MVACPRPNTSINLSPSPCTWLSCCCWVAICCCSIPTTRCPCVLQRAEPAAAHHHRPLHVILPSCPCHSMSRPPAAAPGSCSSLGWASSCWQVAFVRPGRHLLRVKLLKSQMVPVKRCKGSEHEYGRVHEAASRGPGRLARPATPWTTAGQRHTMDNIRAALQVSLGHSRASLL